MGKFEIEKNQKLEEKENQITGVYEITFDTKTLEIKNIKLFGFLNNT